MKNNKLGIVLLVLLGGVLIFFALNRGDFGQARISGQIMQYKSATAGGACVIDANCIEGLRCLSNICTQWIPPTYVPDSMSISADPEDETNLFQDITFSVTLSPPPPADYDFSGWSGKWYFSCNHQDPEKQRSTSGSDILSNQVYVYEPPYDQLTGEYDYYHACIGSSNSIGTLPCIFRIRYEIYYNDAEIKFAETYIGLAQAPLPIPCGG